MAEPKYQSINVQREGGDKPLYCFGCKKKHTLDDVGAWTWQEAKVGNKTVKFCRLCLDCAGCGFIHKNETGYMKSNSQGQFCGKWFSVAAPTMQQKMANMSPEEVMSGVHLGMPMLESMKGKPSEDYSVENARRQKAAKELLK